MFVKPAPGMRVRDPKTRLHIPDAGREVGESSYWQRRVAAGDVIVVSLIPEQSVHASEEQKS